MDQKTNHQHKIIFYCPLCGIYEDISEVWSVGWTKQDRDEKL